MKINRSIEKLSSAFLILSMVLSLFSSPVINTGAVVRAQEGEPTPVPTEVMEPTPIPEEPTAIPEEPTAVPEEPTAVPEEPTATPEEPTLEPTLEPTVESTLEPTQTPTLMESASPTPTITTTPVATELPEVVPLFRVQENKAIPDHYIVVYKSNNLVRASAADGDTGSVMGADIASVEAMGGTIEQTYTSALTGFSAVMSPEALKKLRQNPDIDYIEQDQVVSITDDIEVNTIQNNATWGLDRIDQITGIDGKYTYYLNGTGVHAYVIDTGILASHAEFGGRAVMDYDAIDSTMSDCNGHGTHVAGTIGGTIYGVAKNVTLHGVRVLDCSGSGTSSQVLAGIDWVKAHHQNPAVVNMSLRGDYSPAENQAVASAIASGVTFVVAAGNDTADACTYSPASAPAAITVGATDLTDSPSSFSNYGACLDIFAPGTAITSSWYNGGYNTINGTSMASPHVAGAVALLLQANPSASPSAITNTLMGNAVVGKLNNVGNGSPNKMLYTKPLPNPTAPVLLSPVVGASLNDTTPTFIWNTVNGASQYRIQISNTADFATISRDQLVNEATYTDAGLPEGLFYWRVMSKNPQGIESPWSNGSSFIIDTTAPSGPLLSLPNNGASVEGTPTLEWNPVSDATGYMIEIDDSNVFSIPVVYSNPVTTDGKAITATSLKPATLAAGVTYYWHVRSRDAAGNWGSWSSTRSFTTASPVPQAPSLTSPVSGIVVNTSTPTLTWNAVEYGARYEIQISSDPTFIGADFEKLLKAPGELSHVPASGMADATKYYWRVRALNNTSAAGPWSEVRYFIIDTTGPAAPVLNLPAPESTFIGIPTFTWTAVATANAYQFQYSTDGFLTDPPAFSTPIDTPITTTSYKDLNIPIGFVYTWRVRARDAYGNWGNWSATRWVNVQASLPPAPVVTVPAIGFITNNPTPDFAWNAVTGAVSYEIQIDNQSTFTSPEIVDSSATNTYTPSSSVPADGLYYYRVRAVNATGGPGAWSATRSFTLDTVAPDESALILPLNAATPVGTPTFTWKAVTGANAYQFQYSTDVTFSTIDYSSPGPGYPGTPLAVTSHKPITNMPVGIPYYWHVRARDAAGNWGEWTFSRIITIQAALPGIPVATEPAIGFMTNNTTPTFTWNAVANAATYDIQVDNLSTFISPEIAENVAASTFTPSSPLPADGIYYWRVRAVNATGGAGAWSAARSFTLDTTAPAAPTLTTPLDGATPIGTPTFIWAASAGATNYQFRYSTDNTFGSVDYETADGTGAVQPLAVTSHKPTVDMAVGTTYYWQVRARDKAGNWSVWSAIRSIRTQAALPGIPVVTAPAIGLVTNNTTPTIVWNAVTGAVSYDIQIDNLATFASPEVTGNTATTSFTPSSTITPDALYYYRVRAVNATGGAGAWSAARSFTLDTTAPAAPTLTTPLDGATPIGTPIFIWAASAGATNYQFRYSTDNTFGSVDYETADGTGAVQPLAVTSHKPTVDMAVGTTYYWQVRARDKAGNWSVWSAIRSIRTQAALPGIPVVTAPAIGLVTNNTTPTIVWNAVTGAVSYDIQIDNLATFASPEVTGNTATTSFTPSSAITPDALYYYRVRAVNATGGAGAWSAARSFTLDTTAPAAPTLTTPLDGATPIGTPIFIWAASAGATNYQFRYSTDNTFGSVDYETADGTGAVQPLAVTSHKPTVDMAIGTTYYWQVRARDKAGNWSIWSAIRSIRTQAALPGIPVVTAPAIGLVTNNTTPTIVWNAVTGAVSYDIQIDNLATFASPEVTGTTATTSFTPSSAITPDALYYYRVRAVNATGGAGAWSAARSFTLDTTAPAAPNLSSPLNSAISVGNPTFLWGGVIGANKYEIQLALTSDFASPISLTPGMPLTVTSYKPTSLLNTLKTYYWHVRAGDVAGNWGNWSVARTVSIVPPIPTAPVLQSPATGIFVNNSKPVFEWSNVQNAESYKIQISKVATFATTEYNTTTFNNSYQPGVSLGSDGLYYWRVQAINAIGQSSAWSAVRTLTLDTVAPAVPVLTAPVEGTILPPGVPTFSWAAAAGANAYQFQMDDFFGHVYNTPGGPAAEFTAGTPITVTSHKPDEDKMTPAVLYYWRVRARDAAGNWSEWSNYRRVVKQAPLPIAPTLSSPSDKIWTANQYPIFSWNSVANAVNYEIQVDQYANFIGLNKIDETLSSGVLSWTPASPISGDRYWRVRGINVNGLPGPWSAARKISIEFTSTFTSDAAGWAYSTSQWTLSGGYLVAPGLSTSGFISSATYNAIYSDFTYETRMRMPLSSSAPADYIDNVYGVFVQAGTSSNTVDFTSGYMFLIGQIRDPMYGDWSAYKIYKISNGLWTSMSGQYWLWLTSVNPGEWANIKTISNGSTLAFYVNGMLVKSIANAGPKFGKVGVLTWWNYDKQSVYLDYAYMSQAQAITSTSASTTSTNGTRSILDPGFYAPFGN